MSLGTGGTVEARNVVPTKTLASGLALLVPTVHDGETMFRFCFVNPLTTTDDIELVLDTMC